MNNDPWKRQMSSWNRGTSLTPKTPVKATPKTEYRDTPPASKPEDENTGFDQDILEQDPVVVTVEKEEAEGEEMTLVTPKQPMKQDGLIRTLQKVLIDSQNLDDAMVKILGVCRMVHLELEKGESTNDLLDLFALYGFIMMDALKLAQAFIQPTVEATDTVLETLTLNAGVHTQLASQGSDDQSNQVEDIIPKPEDQNPTDDNVQDTDDNEDLTFLNDLLKESFDADEENASDTEESSTEENSAEENSSEKETPDKPEISRDEFLAIVAQGMSALSQSSFDELNAETLNYLGIDHEWFVLIKLGLTAREWNNMGVLDKASADNIQAYQEYLLNHFTVIDEDTSEDEEMSTIEWFVSKSPDCVKAVFQKVCETHPTFTFEEVMFYMRTRVIYGHEMFLDSIALRKVYDDIEKVRRREARMSEEGDPNSTSAADAFDRANRQDSTDDSTDDETDENADETSEEGGEETSSNNQRRRRTVDAEYTVVEDDDEEEDPRFAEPKKHPVLKVVFGVLGVFVVILIVVFLLKWAFSSDEDDSWTEDGSAALGEIITEDVPEETAGVAGTEEAEAPTTDESANNAGSGLELMPSDATNTAEAEAPAEETEAENDTAQNEKGIVVNACPANPGTVFQLPANQFGAFAKQEDGVYTCLTKVTADQAQDMLNAMKKNGEDSHALRYVVMPESGLMLVHQVLLSEVEEIVAGDADGTLVTFNENDFVANSVTKVDGGYIVCKRIKVSDAKALLQESSPEDEIVTYIDDDAVMVTSNYGAKKFPIYRKELKTFYDAMKEIGASELACTFFFKDETVADGNDIR